jgi:nitroreductase
MNAANPRKSNYPILKLFLDRWSARAFSAEPVTKQDVLTLIEAARWAPSSYNTQPWRFVYSLRGSASWQPFVSTLLPINQLWAQNAAAIVFLLAQQEGIFPGSSEPQPLRMSAFDTGTASGFFALQAAQMGLIAHVMGGFDRDLAAKILNLPGNLTPQVAIAAGKLGDPATLPDVLREREFPSDRIPLAELAFEDAYPGNAG